MRDKLSLFRNDCKYYFLLFYCYRVSGSAGSTADCVSYEIIRLAGNSDNPVVNLLSRPGMWVQNMTTKEPDDSMIEVGIRAVEEVFDWRTWQRENL